MKSYNHIYETFISDENIKKSIRQFAIGRTQKPEVKELICETKENVEKIRKYAENYKAIKRKPIYIFDRSGKKKRKIYVPSNMEVIMQHMIVNALMPIFKKGMYEHSYASIPGRGIFDAKKVIEKQIKKNPGKVKYCLKMDIKKFFDSVPHEIILEKLSEKIHDKKMMEVIEETIKCTETGLPLGFYTSQWFSNWYLQGLDHYIKEELQAEFLIRYADDMVIFGSNKRKLHKMQKKIEKYLKEKLGLTMKNNWQVFRFDYIGKDGKHHGRDLDFMGLRFFRDRTTLRKSLMLNATRKAKKIWKKEKETLHDARQMLSYLGWIKKTDTYSMYLKWIKPFVDFGKLEKRISNYEKRRNGGISHEVVHSTEPVETRGRGHDNKLSLQLCT